jgi:amidohydrolase
MQKQNLEKLKKDVRAAIDRRGDEIIELGEAIWKNPETGFKEFKSSALILKKLKSLGLPCRGKLAVTGCRADLDSGRKGPVLALMGELDSVLLSGHPDAKGPYSAVHACGHNTQIAALFGAAAGLTAAGAEKYIDGKIVFFAVPAEEFLETEFRMGLIKEGKIKFCGGKAELIRTGAVDDIDAAMIVHAGDRYFFPESYNGFVMKKVTFKGKSSHGGLAPEKGINALCAANIALSAVNAQRETFRDDDSVRVHGIITRGGDAVNVIPDTVTLEIQVRAKTPEAIADASKKVDRSLHAGAMAMGAAVEIDTLPGYMPMKNSRKFLSLYFDNVKKLSPRAKCFEEGHRGASTDMGDLGMIIPIFHPYAEGCSGGLHTADFRIADKEKAYVTSAKLLAMTALDLMADGAKNCRDIIKGNDKAAAKKRYLAFMEKMSSSDFKDYAAGK